MFNDFLTRLTSRKFLMAVSTNIILLWLAVTGSTSEESTAWLSSHQETLLVLAGLVANTVGYTFSQGRVDSAAVTAAAALEKG